MEALQIDAVVADLDQAVRYTLIVYKMRFHVLAIDDDAVDEMICPAEKLVQLRSEGSMPALAGKHFRAGQIADDGGGENGERGVVRVHKADVVAPDVTRQLQSSGSGAERAERGDRELDHRNAFGPQLIAAHTLRAKRADVRLETAAIQTERDFRHLAFAATLVELPRHQQDRVFHVAVT